jgi:hypothetical protein
MDTADLDLWQRCTMGFEQYGERTVAYTVLQVMCAIPPATLFSAETTGEGDERGAEERGLSNVNRWMFWDEESGCSPARTNT